MTKKYLAAAALSLAALTAVAADKKEPAPEPGARPAAERWEYAELTYSSETAGMRAAGGFGQSREGRGGRDDRGGRDAGGGPAAPPVRVSRAVARWVTDAGAVEGEGWDGLASKLKANAAAKDAKAVEHKVKLLNHLGSQGWELVSTTGSAWTFKRRASK